jgi:hypothetical protein
MYVTTPASILHAVQTSELGSFSSFSSMVYTDYTFYTYLYFSLFSTFIVGHHCNHHNHLDYSERSVALICRTLLDSNSSIVLTSVKYEINMIITECLENCEISIPTIMDYKSSLSKIENGFCYLDPEYIVFQNP